MPGKLEKFAELETFGNCFSFHFLNIPEKFSLRGKWREHVFKNNNPIILELGCGKGEYSVGLAKKNSNTNYIGVDVKGNRIWTGAKEAITEKINNVAFLRSRIDFIDHCFDEQEVDEIWITFPDPQPQKNRARKRLTHPMFLNRYKKILKPQGVLHLKTDSISLYEFTLETIQEQKLKLIWESNDLNSNCPANRSELTEIKTHYEKLFSDKGEKIKYIQFAFI
ncbi:MAG: tRNA (guanosine(46)-N7)-methyltransferase TrmB [Sphingobacteriaceae bacterium]|nr:tRNA (guanosine(46)-N7)-methyltransferase TrmB [Sphingobacteriaceae bacterium]